MDVGENLKKLKTVSSILLESYFETDASSLKEKDGIELLYGYRQAQALNDIVYDYIDAIEKTSIKLNNFYERVYPSDTEFNNNTEKTKSL